MSESRMHPADPHASVLDQLPADERRQLEVYMVDRAFAAGSCLMCQGDPGDGCYVVTSGTLRVEARDGRGEEPSVLGYLEAGRLVGEMSLVGLPTRSASVYAQTDVKLRWLSAEGYAQLGKAAPAVALSFTRLVAQDMAEKIRRTNERLVSYIPPEVSPAEAAELVARAVAAHSPYSSAWAAQFLADVPTDKDIVDMFLQQGIDTVCFVADSIFAPLDQYLMDLERTGRVRRWVMPSERSVPAVAVGRWLATGQLTLMTMQNSGFSNAMDYLRSVMQTHRIPGVLLASWRGFDPLLDDSEPHVLVGDVTDADTRSTMGPEHVYGRRDGVGLARDIREGIADAQRGNLVCIRVSPPGFTKSYALRHTPEAHIPDLDRSYYAKVVAHKGRAYEAVQQDPRKSRDEALRAIHALMKDQDPFYIVGNGFNPRAMQALKLTENTFENAGGMGSSLAIAWGAAKSNPHQVFVAIDGDQNALMSEMEKVLVSDYPENLYWFILNNGVGESVGPSTSLSLAPWHYELAYVINTRSDPPGSFKYPRVNSSGLKFSAPEAKALAKEIGNLPAQAHLARAILAKRQRP